MMGKGQAAVGIIDHLNKLGAINAVEWRKEEGITFTKSFIAFMIMCIRDDRIALRTANHYRIAMRRYSPILEMLSDREVYCLMTLIEYHIENGGKRAVAKENT